MNEKHEDFVIDPFSLLGSVSLGATTVSAYVQSLHARNVTQVLLHYRTVVAVNSGIVGTVLDYRMQRCSVMTFLLVVAFSNNHRVGDKTIRGSKCY
jgi:hypothetical protein